MGFGWCQSQDKFSTDIDRCICIHIYILCNPRQTLRTVLGLVGEGSGLDLDPKMCKLMAFMTVTVCLGLQSCILLGFR